ncbi:PAS-domain containing protein [Metallibacterium sp.]
MIAGGVLLLVSLAYAGMLFALAWWGDRRPVYPARTALQPLIYSLSLAVYCSAWTFYGAVGTAARSGLAFLPIYLGPILLFTLGYGLLGRVQRIAKRRNLTSIADLIAARFGRSPGLAALITVIAVIAAVPYIALQFKAVSQSVVVLAGSHSSGALITDSALWVALLLAVFAILFGTRAIDATEHHHGMMLAIAVEALIKLLAFLAVALFALRHGPGLIASYAQTVTTVPRDGLPPDFLAQCLLAFFAGITLPRQFQVTIVESEHPDDLRTARWIFPTYLLLIVLAVPLIAAAGNVLLAGDRGQADAWSLLLPLQQNNRALAILAYVGGFSAATGMVIVASVALATMISNDLVMPALLRVRALHLEQRSDLSRVVLAVRRAAILLLAAAAYAYYRGLSDRENLAALGLLSFTAVAQLAPAMLAALYWRGASRAGVYAGLIGGFAVWIYTLLLPALAQAHWFAAGWVRQGPFGIDWLRPLALFNLSGWDPVTHGTAWSLLVNVAALVFVSLRFRPSLEDRLRGQDFLEQPALDASLSTAGDWRGRITVADLRAIAERILGERGAVRAFEDYAQGSQAMLAPSAVADRALLQYTERVLAGAVGAASARRLLMSALSGSGLDVAEVLALLDEASQELRFNRGLLSSTLEHIAQAVSVVDAEMRLVAWNRRYLELFDYPPGLVFVGQSVAELIRYNAERGECGPGEVSEHVAKRIRHMHAGSPHVFERVRTDGRVIEMRGIPLSGGGYVTTYADVTAYKRVELALIEANETLEQRVAERTVQLSEALAAQEHAKREAEAANLSKTRFIAAAGHDLLQPLNAARLFTAALRQQPDLDREAAHLGERIETSFRAAEDLLEGLLDASHLDAGRYHPEIGAVALGELFASLKAQYAVLAAQRGLALRVRETRLLVRSDPQLLRRIIQNLLSNALRYTPHGGVLLGARRRGAGVRIEVWDTGPGIAPEQQRLIFAEFQRLDQPSPWGERGLGLGLSICERIATILDHRLELASTPGRGSGFMVSVARAEGVAVLPRTAPVGGEASPFAHTLDLDVLCLDNDPTILEGMSALLVRWGVRCRTATGIAEVEIALAERVPDLLLLDLHLGADADGLDVLRNLRLRYPERLPAALLTADGSNELQARARALGVPVLLKPIKPAVLRALLAALARADTTRRRAVAARAAVLQSSSGSRGSGV